MSVHFGFHWGMIMGKAGKLVKTSAFVCTWVLRIVAVLFAGYGIYALIRWDIGSYMFLKNQYVFFDFDEPYIFFLVDYIGIMGLFIFMGYYLSEGIKCIWRVKK